jgi:hypothetical protein
MARRRYYLGWPDVAAPSTSLPTPSLALARTPAENLGFSTQAAEFARETDCLLEGTGFEPLVPATGRYVACCRRAGCEG